MDSSEPLSAAHKTPARARFKSRGRFSTHRNQLGLRKNQSVLLESPSIPVPLFVLTDCHSLKMSNHYERNLVSVYNPVFRRPETHLVNVVWPVPISESLLPATTASTSNSDPESIIPFLGSTNDIQRFSGQHRVQHRVQHLLFGLSPNFLPVPTVAPRQSAD